MTKGLLMFGMNIHPVFQIDMATLRAMYPKNTKNAAIRILKANEILYIIGCFDLYIFVHPRS